MEYIGGWSDPKEREYRIMKITGAPIVQVLKKDCATNPNTGTLTGRVGDVINEAQAVELAQRVEMTTTKSSK